MENTKPPRYVYLGNEVYSLLAKHIVSKSYSSVFLFVDTNTARYCLPVFMSKMSGAEAFKVVKVSAGEDFKTIDTCKALWTSLLEEGADRHSLVINLGGGVISDMGGFVALSFKRGIDYVNVPTTLLAMVDAAIGGKTGVDMAHLKNQIGLIKKPELVLIDEAYLQTLPPREKLSGLAEIIKHGLIASDKSIWERLKSQNLLETKDFLAIIAESVSVKLHFSENDIYEASIRKILNFGHTLGHAIETYFLEHPKEPSLTHGESIAIGMITEAYLAHALCGFPHKDLKDIQELLSKYFRKINLVHEDLDKIIYLTRHDKKNTQGKARFALLKDIGEPVLDVSAPEELIRESFRFYMAHEG